MFRHPSNGGFHEEDPPCGAHPFGPAHPALRVQRRYAPFLFGELVPQHGARRLHRPNTRNAHLQRHLHPFRNVRGRPYGGIRCGHLYDRTYQRQRDPRGRQHEGRIYLHDRTFHFGEIPPRRRSERIFRFRDFQGHLPARRLRVAARQERKGGLLHFAEKRRRGNAGRRRRGVSLYL